MGSVVINQLTTKALYTHVLIYLYPSILSFIHFLFNGLLPYSISINSPIARSDKCHTNQVILKLGQIGYPATV